MKSEKLNLRQQIVLCQHIARLVKAKLPLIDHVAQGISVASSDISLAGQQVRDKLERGTSLIDALVVDNSKDSRILSACLHVGQNSNCLDRALESWTSMHISNDRSRKLLQTAMIYPITLIGICLLAVGWTTWHLVPEIQSAYLHYDSQPPVWLKWIFLAREHFIWTGIAVAIALVVPLFFWLKDRRRTDQFGVPMNMVRRFRLQSLATQLAGWQIQAGRPLSETLPLCLKAMGTSEEQTHRAFENLRLHRTLAAMPIETTMVLASLHCGIVDQNQAADHCQKISHRLAEQADLYDQQESRWLPVFIALVVGAVTLFSYGLLVYLPWIGLMTQISVPEG